MESDQVKELAARYRKLYAGVVFDAMKWDAKIAKPSVAPYGCAPLHPLVAPVAGPALVCTGWSKLEGRMDDTARFDVLEHARPGDVYVLGIDGPFPYVAIFGDISAQILQQQGVIAAVLAGCTRDARRIGALGFPVFCEGSRSEDAYEEWSVKRTRRTSIWGCSVTDRDWVFADVDGVLIIPQDKAEEICEAAEARGMREEEIRRELKRGDPREVYRRLGRW